MPDYLLTAKRPNGHEVTERVDATSADEAVQILRDRGYADVVLHTDDIGATYTRHRDVERYVTTKEYVSFRQGLGYVGGVLLLARKLSLTFALTILLAAASLAGRRWLGVPWSIWDTVLLIAIPLPVALMLIAPLFNAVRRYDRFIEAIAWHRWEEALQLVPAIRAKLSPHEAAFREAQALAGLGRLDEALARVRRFAGGQRMPEWLYWSRLASVYSAARQFNQVIATEERAAALAPENSTVLIELADVLLRYRGDARRVRDLLGRARSHAISDLAACFLTMLEGKLALEEGHAAEAVRCFERSHAQFAAFRMAKPIIGVVIDKMHAYQAMAFAKVGDTEAALRHYRLAEPRFCAMRADDLLSRCAKAFSPMNAAETPL